MNMKSKIKKVVSDIQLALMIKARGIGGEVITLDSKPLDQAAVSAIVDDNFNSNWGNLMEADWGPEPIVESSRFGNQKDWDKARKYGMQDLPEIDEYKDMYTDDVSLLESHPDYAKPKQVPIKTIHIESIPYEEVKENDNREEKEDTGEE